MNNVAVFLVVALLAGTAACAASGGRDLASRRPRPHFSEKAFFVEDMKTTCPFASSLGVNLRWTAEAGSASFAPPLIYDLMSDGRKEIILPTFTHYVEALDGETGRDVLSWPFTHPRFKSQASPIVVDIEPDGTGEVMVSTYYGELLFFTEEGLLRKGSTLRLPRIIVDRNWSNNFKTEDREAVAARNSEMQNSWKKIREEVLSKKGSKGVNMKNKNASAAAADAAATPATALSEKLNKKLSEVELRQRIAVRGNAGGFISKHKSGKDDYKLDESVVSVPPTTTTTTTTTTTAAATPAPTAAPATPVVAAPDETKRARPGAINARTEKPAVQGDRQPLFDAGADNDGEVGEALQPHEAPEDFQLPEYDPQAPLEHDADSFYGYRDADNHVLLGAGAPLSAEARASMNLAFHPELFEAYAVGDDTTSSTAVHNAEHARMYVDTSPNIGNREPEPTKAANGEKFDPRRHVYLQPHILATPVVADIDLDGQFDIIVPVSYYLDTGHPGEFNDPAIDTDLYVVSEIVVLNMGRGTVKWRRRLRTTTKHTEYPAYMMSSPVVIDVDGNMLMDVVVTTGDGMLNVFDYRGNPHPGWPVQLAPIHGPALVDDFNGDHHTDVCAGDSSGTIACFSNKGEYMWDRQLTGSIADGMTAGDVNGDGILDIVTGTTSGQVWAVNGRTGEVLPNFPVQISSSGIAGGDDDNNNGEGDANAGGNIDAAPVKYEASIVAPPLLINLNRTAVPLSSERGLGLHIVVPGTDGSLYFVSGTTGCTEIIDLGHASYTQVLADDLIGNGKIALVVTTLSGAVHVLETRADATPLKTWPSRPVGLNGYTAREGRAGIAVRDDIRRAHDVQGDHWTLVFDITDTRNDNPATSMHGGAGTGGGISAADAAHNAAWVSTYYIVVTYGRRLIAFGGVFHTSGRHAITIPAPPERMHTIVHVYMRLSGGQVVEDSFAMSFNAHVLDTAKYIFVLPFLAVMGALCLVKKAHEMEPQNSMHAWNPRYVGGGGGGGGSRGGAQRHYQHHAFGWGDDDDEVDVEEFMLALERERLLRALRGRGIAVGRYGAGHAATAAAAAAATQQRRAPPPGVTPATTGAPQQQRSASSPSQRRPVVSFNDDDV